MLLSQKIRLLESLGVIDWLQNDKENDRFRVVINGLADYFFYDSDYYDFMPFCWSEEIIDHFRESGYDVDWYSFLSGEFARDIEKYSTKDIYYNVSTLDYKYEYEDAKQLIIEFVREWCANCRQRFLQEIKKT
ncbi:hypothetical protein NX722_08925 [Endozoicomonas gorgoniicola]|uniref:Uncharacterized protein n=1 Tax=Endozoicomonas gorgoniicola TaxID=1234144 RepID=A0ABT3MTR7_9GAMM|nr:hypothetical protein [Endozoicomonas gorgoniicola]MCW7552762.1 hypothetical protein [Endozoicomonas gorgoniicola]